jgi:peptide/nickel transport system substrate-binding protein
MSRLRLLTPLLVLLALLAACGGNTPPAVAEPPAAAAEPTVAQESSAESQTAEIGAVREAPMLNEKVLAGTLPPLEERIPAEPLVVDLPWAEVGQYGGTLKRTTNDSDFEDTSQYMYGHSPLHWTEGGAAVGPGLAKSWQASDDATQWTFVFREGTKWSDGQPFTVDDILFWWEDMALNEDHPEPIPAWALAGGAPMQADKIDDYTIRFTFAGPAPLTESQLAQFVNGGVGPGFGPFPKHYLSQFHPDYSDAADFEEFTEKQDWWTNPERPVLNAWMPVELEPGNRLILERNPYYYVVDRDGNQLPYIDRFEVTYSENPELLKLRIINGEVNIHIYPLLSLRDLAVLKDNEANGNYRVLLWDNGAGGAPGWGVNWNNPDDEKRSVVRMPQYRRALSHGMNRERIKTVAFLGLGQELSTGTMSPNAAQFNRSPRGQEMLRLWRESYVAYDPELAMSLLDEIDVVDKDGDGWRDLPSGAPLEVRLDFPAGNAAFVETAELIKDDWRAIGLNAFVNTVPGDQLGVMTTEATYDIRLYEGGAPDGPDLLIYPQWLISYESSGRWAPLYGAWMAVQGTPAQDTELDMDPRERTPPREEPEEGDPMLRMWELYQQAIKEPDTERRDELVFEIIQIHIDDGPFLLGGVADPPNIVIVGAQVHNVPDRDQIPLGGWLGPWVIGMPGAITYPEVYYIE